MVAARGDERALPRVPRGAAVVMFVLGVLACFFVLIPSTIAAGGLLVWLGAPKWVGGATTLGLIMTLGYNIERITAFVERLK